MRQLILVRHAESAGNLTGRVQGRLDFPLSVEGRRQADRLARRLGTGDPIAAIVSSPLRRATETARAIADTTGAPLTLDERLAEVDFGDISGLHREELKARHPEVVAAWGANRRWPERPGAESPEALRRRVVAALEDALATLEDGGAAVVVSHGVALDAGLRGLLEIDAAGWRLFGFGNAGLGRVVVDGEGTDRVFRILTLNDRAHLSNAEAPPARGGTRAATRAGAGEAER